ncbi:MAG: hypothetical protein ABMB14_07025 [Myxococcota bacterium]
MRSETTLFPLFALAFAACTTNADAYRAILPDERLLIEDFDSDSLARGVGDPSDYYTLTRDVTRETNAGIGAVLELVGAITAFDPTWTDDDAKALWGPWLDDGTYGQLWVTETAEGGYEWAIELRPEASDEDAWVGVLGGSVDPGATADESAGRFAMDLTAIDAVGAGDDDTTGALGVEYTLRVDGAAATVAFGDISEDGALPQDAAYRYDLTQGKGGYMDLAFEEDVSDPANGTFETAIVRSRWDGTGAGRADAYVTGGDLGPLTYTETDCWDVAHQTVFLENNFELVSAGDPAACAFADASFNESR